MTFLREIGHQSNRVIIKTDQASPIRTVADKLAKERGEAQTIMEYSPVKSSGGNGVIERCIEDFGYHVRSMMSTLDVRLGTTVGATSNIQPRMIEYSNVFLNR